MTNESFYYQLPSGSFMKCNTIEYCVFSGIKLDFPWIPIFMILPAVIAAICVILS